MYKKIEYGLQIKFRIKSIVKLVSMSNQRPNMCDEHNNQIKKSRNIF